MKKIINYTVWAVGAIVIVTIASRLNVENEVTDLLKTIAQKIMPWINEVVYS